MKPSTRKFVHRAALVALVFVAILIVFMSSNDQFPERQAPRDDTSDAQKTEVPQDFTSPVSPPYTQPPYGYHHGQPLHPDGSGPKGGPVPELDPMEAVEERMERLDEEMAALLRPLAMSDAPPERVLKDLVMMSCTQPASNLPFWDRANEIYRSATSGSSRRLLVNDWPRLLAEAYNDRCVETDVPSGMAL